MMQYIGARYVPLVFNNNGSSEWVANYNYEPLTIVTYNNSSYTSTKQVPATVGNPVDNPEYWVMTGNYNNLLNTLTQTVNTLENTVDSLSKQSEINTSLLTKLSKSIYNLSALNVLVITDSYGDKVNNVTPWTNSLYNQIIGVGGKCTIKPESGGGFARKGNTGKDFVDLLSEIPNDNDYNLLIVQGCTNDSYVEIESLNKAMQNFINIAIAQKKLRPFLFNVSKSILPGSSVRTTFRNTIENYAKTYGYIYDDLSPYYMISKSYFQSDGLHPNAIGASVIFQKILNFIFTGTSHINYYEKNEYIECIVNDKILTMYIKSYSKNLPYKDHAFITIDQLPSIFFQNLNYVYNSMALAIVNGERKPIQVGYTYGTILTYNEELIGTSGTLIIEGMTFTMPLQYIN